MMGSAAIIYGDKRQTFLCDLADGYFDNVFTYNVPDWDNTFNSIKTTIENADYIILPINFETNGYIFGIERNEFVKMCINKTVICGNADCFYGKPELNVFDYCKDEAFQINNAALTAEAAISTAVTSCDGSLYNSKCLISGSGRIAKILAGFLKPIAGDITITARNTTELLMLKIYGFNTVVLKNLSELNDYDYIFNTVPFRIFDSRLLKTMKKDCVYIELASAPYGIDAYFAENNGINIIKAGGLPGKFSPYTAATIIMDSIIKFTREVNV